MKFNYIPLEMPRYKTGDIVLFHDNNQLSYVVLIKSDDGMESLQPKTFLPYLPPKDPYLFDKYFFNLSAVLRNLS